MYKSIFKQEMWDIFVKECDIVFTMHLNIVSTTIIKVDDFLTLDAQSVCRLVT